MSDDTTVRSFFSDLVSTRSVMPRSRAPVASPVLPPRTSGRKRKRANEPDVDSQQEDSASDESATPVQKAAAQKPARRGRPKKDIVSQQTDLVNISNETASSSKKVIKDESSKAANTTGKRRPVGQKANGDLVAAKVVEKVEVKVELEQDDSNKTVYTTKKVVTAPHDKPEKIVRKRKTKEEKEAEAMPLAARTTGLKMFVGAHVSIAKGLENAITNSLHIGGNAFALFLKSQRKWDNPALKDENRDAFKHHCTHHQYDQSAHVVPHGSYLVNLASPDTEMSKKSYDTFVDDLHRCEALGIKHYNFHPGSTNKEPLDEAIGRLAANLNRALAETKTVVPLLENMAGRGSIIGSRFSDLRDIIAAIKPEFKSRIGICIDTCHTFAAGYDLRSPEAFKKTFQDLDETVGLKYLKAMHINDSKAPLGSHRDLHQNIGAGFLGLRAFHNVMNDARLQDIPLVLETPCERPDPDNPKKAIDDKNMWAREIKLLESLIGMDPESQEFKTLEADLSEKGRVEREKMEQSIAALEEKARKKAQKEREKGQQSISAMFGMTGKKKKKKKKSVSSSSSLSDVEPDA